MRGVSGKPGSSTQQRFERFLASSRLLILIPVIFLLLDAAASFGYGSYIFVTTLTDVVHGPSRPGGTLGRFLVVMDTYLVGATMMIAAFGFYSLFIDGHSGRQPSMMPRWLNMHDLEDLKARVVSMLILVAAITFVDVAVETHDEQGLLYLGIGIAVVIVALTAFLRFGRQMTHAQADAAPSQSAGRSAAQGEGQESDSPG